jgi:C4-dicarboxylate transporter DctM subunit
MDPIVYLGLGAIVVMLALGVEILVCLGLGAVILTFAQSQFQINNIGITAFGAIDSFPLLAMPLYILTGDLIAHSGIAERLVNFSRTLIGWLRGGLAVTLILASGFFAAISGSNSATVAAMGRMMVGPMRKDGYPDDFTAAVAACGGTVGIIIPPSIVFVIYGVASGVSVGDLFLGGILPGILMVAVMVLVSTIVCHRRKVGSAFPFSLRAMLREGWRANLAFGATAVILGGIYGGVFTPSEAAAIAVAYCLVAGLVVTREIKPRDIPAITNRSSDIAGLVAPIIAMAIALSQVMGVLGLPKAAVDFFLGLSSDPTVLMLLILVVLLIAGMIMETTPVVLLLTPLLVPVANSIGIHPVHFGVVVVMALAIGFVTPPVGLNLFVASAITGVPVHRVAASSVLIIVGLLAVLLLVAFVPQLTLALVPSR